MVCQDWQFPNFGAEEVGGCDAAGTVEAVGPGVSGFGQGDRVAVYTKILGGDRAGTYAEYTVGRNALPGTTHAARQPA